MLSTEPILNLKYFFVFFFKFLENFTTLALPHTHGY